MAKQIDEKSPNKSYKQVQEKSSFTSTLGFVLTAAGSAVGLGNIWRFPYLAAKDGGGLFLFIYFILALTFGFTLLITEAAIGRKTKSSSLTAYEKLNGKWKHLGTIATLVSAIVLPFYSVIGGWVIQYFITFLIGQGPAAAQDAYFTSFISGAINPVATTLLFLGLVSYVVLRGVNKGLESYSKALMPLLFVFIIIISLYSLTLSFTDDSGITRTGLQGLMIYLIPNFSGVTFSRFLEIALDAIGQLFFSLSVAGGVMVTYGSYMQDDSNLMTSVNQIEFFDTMVAFLAGVMIIPAVYTFSGTEGMTASGPGLMFVALPKIFNEMGFIGNIIGFLFFAMVLFAAITSAISQMEVVVASVMEYFRQTRAKAIMYTAIWAIVMAVIVCLGYNILNFEIALPNGSTGQILDVMDYISNSVLMPIVAILTCILIGWIAGPDTVVNEVEKSGTTMGRKTLYNIMIKWVAPVLLFILLLKAFGL